MQRFTKGGDDKQAEVEAFIVQTIGKAVSQ